MSGKRPQDCLRQLVAQLGPTILLDPQASEPPARELLPRERSPSSHHVCEARGSQHLGGLRGGTRIAGMPGEGRMRGRGQGATCPLGPRLSWKTP